MLEQSFLSLEVIWKDEDMLELQVVASNKIFKGITQVYDQVECLLQLSKQLLNFSIKSEPIFLKVEKRIAMLIFH